MCECGGKCPSCPERAQLFTRDTQTLPMKLRSPVPLCTAPDHVACRLGYSASFRAIAVSGPGCAGCGFLDSTR